MGKGYVFNVAFQQVTVNRVFRCLAPSRDYPILLTGWQLPSRGESRSLAAPSNAMELTVLRIFHVTEQSSSRLDSLDAVTRAGLEQEPST